MQKIRSIKPEFWDDEALARLPLGARLFFIGTWTFADDQGVIRGKASYLRNKIFPYDDFTIDQVRDWLDGLIEQQMIIPFMYNEESYLIIKSFSKHQRIDKRYERFLIEPDIVNEILSKIAEKQQDTDEPITPRERSTSAPRVPRERSTSAPRVPRERSTSTPRALDAGEERRGEDRKGEERKGIKGENSFCQSVDDFPLKILDDEDFCILIQKQYKITPQEIPEALDRFVTYKKGLSELNHSSYAQFKRNFFRWLKTAPNGTNNGKHSGHTNSSESQAHKIHDGTQPGPPPMDQEKEKALLDELLRGGED